MPSRSPRSAISMREMPRMRMYRKPLPSRTPEKPGKTRFLGIQLPPLLPGIELVFPSSSDVVERAGI
jgi:hypothetical protein